MPPMIEFTIGILAAVLTIILVQRFRKQQAPQSYAIALIIAALIYILFALFGSATAWLPVEIVGLVIYTAFAFLGLKYSPWFLGVGWAAHVAWDVWLHGAHTPFVPSWYPVMCVAYDLILAGYILYQTQQVFRFGRALE